MKLFIFTIILISFTANLFAAEVDWTIFQLKMKAKKVDVSGNGVTDLIQEFSSDGQLTRSRMDRNSDGKSDIWHERVAGNSSSNGGHSSLSLFDDDYNGVAERRKVKFFNRDNNFESSYTEQMTKSGWVKVKQVKVIKKDNKSLLQIKRYIAGKWETSVESDKIQ